MKKKLIAIFCIMLVLTMTACGAGSSQDGGEGENASDKASGDVLTFETETFDGAAFTSEDIKDARLVMINFWEPWCGPCVGEMPDLEKLYEEYKDEGFVILGVFSETEQDDDAADILEDCGTTYPVLRYTGVFDQFQTGYVPTTVFITGDGALAMKDPVIGAQSYDAWEATVRKLLEDL